jgi:hypothetical protein
MEVLGMLKLIGSEQELPLLFKIQPVIVFKMTGYYGMIKGLCRNEAFILMPGVEALEKQGHRAVEEKYSQYQCNNDNDFHKVPFFFVTFQETIDSTIGPYIGVGYGIYGFQSGAVRNEENLGGLIKRK